MNDDDGGWDEMILRKDTTMYFCAYFVCEARRDGEWYVVCTVVCLYLCIVIRGCMIESGCGLLTQDKWDFQFQEMREWVHCSTQK